jgi:hypothetical protein
VVTHRTLRFSLFLLESLLAITPNVRVWNCSDGARIVGAMPAELRQMRSGRRPGERQAVVDAIVKATVPDGVAVNARRLRRFEAAFADWLAAVRAACGAVRAAGGGLVAIHDALRAWLVVKPETAERRAVRLLVEGSLMMMFHHAFHRALRHGLIDDPAYCAMVLDAYDAAFAAMAARFEQAMAAAAGPAI